jgi:DNA-binding CsgD family transcriptional regulator
MLDAAEQPGQPSQLHKTKGYSMKDQLTPGETHILQQTADGLSQPEIAATNYHAVATVKFYRKRIYMKLGATGAAHAVALGLRKGLIS